MTRFLFELRFTEQEERYWAIQNRSDSTRQPYVWTSDRPGRAIELPARNWRLGSEVWIRRPRRNPCRLARVEMHQGEHLWWTGAFWAASLSLRPALFRGGTAILIRDAHEPSLCW